MYGQCANLTHSSCLHKNQLHVAYKLLLILNYPLFVPKQITFGHKMISLLLPF